MSRKSQDLGVGVLKERLRKIKKQKHEDPKRRRRSDGRRRVSHLVEVVDVLDGLGEGGLELVELLLDDSAVTVGSVALSLSSLDVDLAVVDIASKVVSLTRAGRAGVTT